MAVPSRRVRRAAPPGPPLALTHLVGRVAELEEIRRLLAGSRLLTLTGAGGSGKTRLAAETARRIAEETAGGSFWVELAGLADPDLLPALVLTALGLREQPCQRSVAAALCRRCGCEPILLVLDNCEHLVDACARLAEELLTGCPQLRILTTSREALGIPGEQVWLVPPLSLPCQRAAGASELLRSEAVQLFVERARAVAPSFEVDERSVPEVARICCRLDGLPLAIELAAARVRVLSTGEIADRLEHAFDLLTGGRTALPRHRTLQAAIGWSHDLLTAEERVLFRRLAAFADGFTLEAAETVGSGGEVERERVLDLVAALVDKSLVARVGGWPASRFRLLETVRRFAWARLEEAGEADQRAAALALSCLDLAERAEPHLVGAGRGSEWMERLVAEEGNLRAALTWFEEQGDADSSLRLASALPWFWFTRGEFGEARRRLATALALAAERGDPEPLVLARGRVAFGNVLFWQGQVEGVGALIERSLEPLREAGERSSLTMALVTLGTVANLAGDPATARRHLDEAVTVAAAGSASVLLAIAHYHQGLASQAWGELEAARESFQQGIAIGRAIGSKAAIAHPAALLGHLEYRLGRLDEALEQIASGLALLHELDDRWSLVQTIEAVAQIAADRDDPAGAARLLGACRRLRDEMGALPPWVQREGVEAATARLVIALGEARFSALGAEGAALPLDRLVEEALAMAASLRSDTAVEGVARAPEAEGGGDPARCPTTPSGPLPALRVAALGPLEVTIGGEPVADDRWGSARARELLLILLVHGSRGRDPLAETLWPEAPADRARNSLHVTVHRLRKALGDPRWVVTEGDLYSLTTEATPQLDAAEFEQVARSALADCRAGGDALAELERALALYRGDFLTGLEVGGWADEIRDRLGRLHDEVLAASAEALIGRRAFADAADRLERLIARDDLDEAPWRQLMRCAAQLGHRSRALQLYRRLEERLREELDVEPQPETVALLESLQSGERPWPRAS